MTGCSDANSIYVAGAFAAMNQDGFVYSSFFCYNSDAQTFGVCCYEFRPISRVDLRRRLCCFEKVLRIVPADLRATKFPDSSCASVYGIFTFG